MVVGNQFTDLVFVSLQFPVVAFRGVVRYDLLCVRLDSREQRAKTAFDLILLTSLVVLANRNRKSDLLDSDGCQVK